MREQKNEPEKKRNIQPMESNFVRENPKRMKRSGETNKSKNVKNQKFISFNDREMKKVLVVKNI